MCDITRITIKSTSGYCCIQDAYKDKLVITPDFISYEYTPELESDHNYKRKWSYKTNRKSFENKFYEIAKKTIDTMENDILIYYTDVGHIDFYITYSDKSKIKKTYWMTGDEFEELFMLIRELVPRCESIPHVLLLSKDDYDDLIFE